MFIIKPTLIAFHYEKNIEPFIVISERNFNCIQIRIQTALEY